MCYGRGVVYKYLFSLASIEMFFSFYLTLIKLIPQGENVNMAALIKILIQSNINIYLKKKKKNSRKSIIISFILFFFIVKLNPFKYLVIKCSMNWKIKSWMRF